MKADLDNNICIYIIKRHPESVLNRFRAFPVGDIGISSITLAELEYGAAKSGQPKKNSARPQLRWPELSHETPKNSNEKDY
jgi:tRNA(fMet)-specific endonuclease VapC